MAGIQTLWLSIVSGLLLDVAPCPGSLSVVLGATFAPASR